MAEDIKSLSKKNTDLEKRLKVAEAKIKALADNMTSPKDIQKFMDVVEAKQTDGEKRAQRLFELAQKENDAARKAQEKGDANYYKELQKELEMKDKRVARREDMLTIDHRLQRLEAMIQTIGQSKR